MPSVNLAEKSCLHRIWDSKHIRLHYLRGRTVTLGGLLGIMVLVTAILASTTSHANLADSGMNDQVLALILFNDDLIAGGKFTQAGGVEVNRIARWDGATWHPLGQGVAGDQYLWDDNGDTLTIEPVVNTLAIYNGDLIAGGSFTTAGGSEIHSIARWDGSAWYPVGDGIREILTFHSYGVTYNFPPQVMTLCPYNGYLVAGGIFDEVEGNLTQFIAQWDGVAWLPMGIGFAGGLPPRVITQLANGTDLYAGGYFELVRNPDQILPSNHIALWNGQKWNILGEGFGPDSPFTGLHCLTLFDGKLIAGGNFQTAGTGEAQNVAAWTGTDWQALGGGVANPVNALVVFKQQLYAGAQRWEGNHWINALQTNGPVTALLVLGNELVVGGSFSVLDGEACQNIISWRGPTPVYLVSFTATRQARAAHLTWEIAFQAEPTGFTVWREVPGEQRVPVGTTHADVMDPFRFEFLDAEAPAEAVDYWLREARDDGEGVWLGPAHLAAWTPTRLHLAQNQPNPFNPQTTLRFTLPRAAPVRLAIHDSRGRRVTLLVDEVRTAGEHIVTWDGLDAQGRAVASGSYLAVLQTPSGTESRNLTLAR